MLDDGEDGTGFTHVSAHLGSPGHVAFRSRIILRMRRGRVDQD